MSAVEEAFAATPRRWFLPADQRRLAATDQALPIGWGQTNSQPRTVRDMLELLDVQPGQRVLDVGSGSGWSTALLGHLVGGSGSVVGVERVPELVERGRRNLARCTMSHARIVAARTGELGWADEAPYDRILVSAAAHALPQPLVEQLGPGGVMVLPVDGEMQRVVRAGQGVTVTGHGRYSFVPLRT